MLAEAEPKPKSDSTDDPTSTENELEVSEDMDLPSSEVMLFIREAVIEAEPEAKITHSPLILLIT